MNATEESSLSAGGREPRWKTVLCFLLLLAAIQLVLGPKIRLSQWAASAEYNAGIREAVAWMDGRLDLPDQGPDPSRDRMHDTAYYNGKVYNVFPPLVGFLTVLLSPLHKLLLDRADLWLRTPHLLLFFWPLSITGFLVFRRQVGDSAWAALLTLGWMGGTAVLPNLAYAGEGQLAQMYHVASQVGLLILSADLIGRQRVWPGLLGLLIATWSRQMTFLYALPLLWVARRRGRLGLCVAGLGFIAAPLLVLNHLKFGNPLDFGYRHIYVNREAEELARKCTTYGTFSHRFIPENFYYMHLAPPVLEEVSFSHINIKPKNLLGTSIWLTTPLLLYVLVGIRAWWSDPKRRLLMLSTLPVMLGLLCYHGTGFIQAGWNRFALDYLPIWLVVIAPLTRGGMRSWLTVCCIAWSLLYFQAIVPNAALLARPHGG